MNATKTQKTFTNVIPSSKKVEKTGAKWPVLTTQPTQETINTLKLTTQHSKPVINIKEESPSLTQQFKSNKKLTPNTATNSIIRTTTHNNFHEQILNVSFIINSRLEYVEFEGTSLFDNL